MDWRKNIGWDAYLKPFLYKKLPSKTGWSAVLGTLCALIFVIMALTGMVLAFYYVPDPDKAWDSVNFISNEVALGRIVRGLHHWGAGAMVLLVFVHLMVSYLHGSYQNPRQLTWVTGAFLFVIVLGLGFTGYLLPWDMKAYWATMVGANIPNQFPGVGNYITRFILGGSDISGFTLTRFYSVHTLVLPAALVLFAGMHIYLMRIHNLSDPRERMAGEQLPPDDGKPFRFYPEQTNRASLAFGLLFVALLLLAAFFDPPMEERAGTFIADYLPRPEWYYMWLFQLLTYFSGRWETIGSILLFGGMGVALFGVPFFSESKIKGAINRPVSIAVASTLFLCIVYLTWVAYHEASPYNKTILVPGRELTAEQRQGLLLFVRNECAYCHNILGEGGHRIGPDLSNVARKKRDLKYLTTYISDPESLVASTTMPAYEMTDEQLKQLAEFLLALDFRGKVEPVRLDSATILEDAKKQESGKSALAVPELIMLGQN
ncbi:MAG: cytochrome b N-terminal domain-containing protein [Desulfovibrionaceae bacterium]|nr:cytochrome b N-terminal domain-containing protein [Desulfovibrionaceae bacterium]